MMFHCAPAVSIHVVPFEDGHARADVGIEAREAIVEDAGIVVVETAAADEVDLRVERVAGRVVVLEAVRADDMAVAAQPGRVMLRVVLMLPRVTGMVEMK